MEIAETPSLNPLRCSAHLFQSFTLPLANLYEVPLPKCEAGWWQRFTSLVCPSSLFSLSFTSVMFSSLSKPFFPHFTDLSTLSVHTRDVRKVSKTWIACQSYFIILTDCTHDIRNDDRLECLVNHILLFSQSVSAMYENMTDYYQCGARSGLPQ